MSDATYATWQLFEIQVLKREEKKTITIVGITLHGNCNLSCSRLCGYCPDDGTPLSDRTFTLSTRERDPFCPWGFVSENGILDSTFTLSRSERACCPRGYVFEFYIPLSNWVDVNFISLEFVGGGGEVLRGEVSKRRSHSCKQFGCFGEWGKRRRQGFKGFCFLGCVWEC
jgi:hypothetical protein